MFFRNKKKELRQRVDEIQLQQCIAQAERQTSGEIKLYIESHNPLIDIVERAAEVFYSLEMQKTDQRNAVIIYLAYHDREFALFGDEGIFEKYSQAQWQELCDHTDAILAAGDIQQGLEYAIEHVGKWLSTEYPYSDKCERNELPDEIVFGQ